MIPIASDIMVVQTGVVVIVVIVVDDDVGRREAFAVDGVVRLEAKQQRLVHGNDLRGQLQIMERAI